MKFIIFCLIDPGDVELTPNGEETFLDFFQIGTVMSSEFLRMVSLNWIDNADEPVSFNVTHFLAELAIDSNIFVKLWKRNISFTMIATVMQHK